MTTYVALLRAINLAGHNKVAMTDLCALFTTLRLHDARSLLQTGNVVFRSEIDSAAELERLLEDGARKDLRVDTAFFVRTASELKGAIAANPFRDQARSDPSHLLMLFLKDAPARAAVTALQEAIKGGEVVGARGRHAYALYPDGIGRSKLTSTLIEKHLGTRATGRNWNTVLKLHALAQQA